MFEKNLQNDSVTKTGVLQSSIIFLENIKSIYKNSLKFTNNKAISNMVFEIKDIILK